jgi:hypothetical protein
MPVDANITENVIKQLGKKLRLIEASPPSSPPKPSADSSSAATASNGSRTHAAATTTASRPSSSPASTPSPTTGSNSSSKPPASNTEPDARQKCVRLSGISQRSLEEEGVVGAAAEVVSAVDRQAGAGDP